MFDCRSFARIGDFHNGTLLEISIDSIQKSKSLKKKIEDLKNKGYFQYNQTKVFNEQEKIHELENSLLKETIKVVVFLSAFLESYFFELSAITLGQRYTINHIEKLDLVSKIILIPRLITGKEINKSLHFWSEIKNLIKWRNKIIHNKTKDATEFFNNKNLTHYDPKPLFDQFDIIDFLDSIKDLFKELDRIDPKGFHTNRLNIHLK